MFRLVHILLIVLAMGMAGCNSGLSGASLVEQPDGSSVILITNSPGGVVADYDKAFADWSRIPGVTVEIQRWCASACTELLGYFEPEQICLWPEARLGFHSATRRSVEHPNQVNVDSISTLIMFAGYPSWIQQRLFAAGVMGSRTGNPMATVGADDFFRHGYSVCRHSVLTAVGPGGAPRSGG